jgi:3-oxoacyl-[acyl-carrier-protein] synthase II
VRLLITGLGLTTGLGSGATQVFRRLCAGESALAPLTLFDTSAQRCKLGAQAPGLDVDQIAPAGEAWRWSRTDALGLLASREALLHARLDPRRSPTALIVGGSTGGMFEGEPLLAALHRDPSSSAPDPRFFCHPLVSTADRLREALGPFFRARTLCSACSGGSNAILLGALWLRLGLAERVLVGAAEGLCRLTFAGFDALSITDPEGCRPFDLRRRGMNLGEGAAFLVLETAASARERGVAPLAELAGWASGSEATHLTQPEDSGATVASLLRRALDQARVAPADLDFVSAHGTGTPRNDPAEAAALRLVFAGLPGPLVSSHKGQLGHTLSSAGAVGAVLATLAMVEGIFPPTGGLSEPDPACELRHVLGAGHPGVVRNAAVHAFGFGGLDTVLVLRAPGGLASAGVLPTPGGSASVEVLRALDGPASVEAPLRQPVVLTAGRVFAPPGGVGAVDWAGEVQLDPDRTRRFDPAARVVTGALQEVLRGGHAGLLGAVAGSAFGGVASCADHHARSEAAGGRCVSPLQFPNLVPSSPVASAAIHAGLRGPVLAAADLGISGEVAAFTAIELLQAGEADGMAVAAFAERSGLVEKVFDPLLLGPRTAPAAEGAVSLLLEREEVARARGARVLARVLFHDHGFGVPAAIAPPQEGDEVFLAGDPAGYAELLAALGWAAAPVRSVAAQVGQSEVAGAQAMALAASSLAEGPARRCLVVGRGPGRWSALLLEGSRSP